jgi:glycosyltransferase involved in cell wall biosynthesis
VKTLVVLGDPLDERPPETRPRRDYEPLVKALDANVLHAGELGKRRGRTIDGIRLARMAAARASHYDNVYCDSEHIGLPLAFLLRSNRGPRLSMIGHYLTPAKKRTAVRALRLAGRFDAVALHSPAQVTRAKSLGFREDQLQLMPYQVDTEFWTPTRRASDCIVSVGREFRDYGTLVSAAEGLDATVEIAIGSHWSARKSNAGHALPPNVRMGARDYVQLRELYGRARFVVVPLHEVDFQAGIITILEAMAMGKAVIVSRTRGQSGAVSGSLFHDGIFTDIGEHAWSEDTGIYVPPADAHALRAAMAYLLENPGIAQSMGEAGRRYVLANATTAHFAQRLAAMIAPSRVQQMRALEAVAP